MYFHYANDKKESCIIVIDFWHGAKCINSSHKQGVEDVFLFFILTNQSFISL